MSSNNESIGKTLTVVVALCLVCAIIVSFASVQLRPLQQANKTQDIQRNILAAADIEVSGTVSDTFNSKIEARVVDMSTVSLLKVLILTHLISRNQIRPSA